MKDNQLLWTIPSPYGEIKVLVERGLPLVAGDKCMFYNAITVVDEIQNPNDPIEEQSASITTDSYMSADDAEFLKKPHMADTWGKMKHGFSVAQMPKLLGCTHPDVGVPLIDEEGNFI